MRFFATDNIYATESSVGFANTWRVLVFSSLSDRNLYVAKSKDIATRPIYKKEISKYFTDKPKPFSGEAFRVEPGFFYDPSIVGQVVISSDPSLKKIF